MALTKLFAFNLNESLFCGISAVVARKKLDCDWVYFLASFPGSKLSPEKNG